MALLDKFAMKLASDLEKQSSENATVDIKTNNIGEHGNKTVEWNIFSPLKYLQLIVVALSYERTQSTEKWWTDMTFSLKFNSVCKKNRTFSSSYLSLWFIEKQLRDQGWILNFT